MALYYKVTDIEGEDASAFEGIQVHQEDSTPTEGPCIKYDFSQHVLIELLDNVTPESKLWKELGLVHNKNVVHKRLLVDPHRVNCRRAIVICKNPDAAREMAKRLTQVKIMKRCVCAIVIQELLSDVCLFEEQIIRYGDKESQQQLVYVTDLNRPREPTSLARYLREKFSPFGTILSVLVSEGKDGYALPEGVIRFAHLSEAFAAELAYDQCAVAMERLSVTTHHNILLSQCDLKARLKEAQLRHSTEACANSNQCDIDTLPKPLSPVVNDHDSDLERETANSSSSSVISEVAREICPSKFRQNENENAHLMETQNVFPTDSAELADVLKNSCKDSLVDCLKVITMGSESSASKRPTDATSVASGSEAVDLDQSIPRSSSPTGSNIAALSSRDKSWSSRVMGWITEIPSADDMPRYNDTWNDHRLSSGSGTHPKTSPNDNQNENMQYIADIVSNSGSFVTCRNGDTSYNSLPPSPASTVKGEAYDLNNTILQSGRVFSPEKSPAGSDDGERQCENDYPASNQLPLNNASICPVSSSQKRKNSSLITQKLSLKSQRLDSSQTLSEVSESETTIHLPSVSNNRQCFVVLDSMPQLNELARSFNSFKTPYGLDTLQNSSLKSNVQLPTSESFRLRTGSTVSESSNTACSIKSTRSLPIRRSSRRTTHQDDQKASSVCGDLLRDVRKKATPTSTIAGVENRLTEEIEESPLRSWLKNELKSSTNNRIPGFQESTKSILCATANKVTHVSRKLRKQKT